MMNKSTPLNQLSNSSQQGTNSQFVNEQHRHIVNQAQNAVQNFALPTNTQLGEEYLQDGDTTIQETLMQLNGIDSTPSQNSMSQHTPTRMVPIAPTMSPPSMQQQNLYSPPPPQQQQQPYHHQATPSISTEVQHDKWWSFIGEIDELKIVGLVILVSFVVTLMPTDHILATYVPAMLSSMPYAETMTQSIICGIVFYVAKALLM